MNFRFFNIPVYIHPAFWLFLLLFTNVYLHFSIENCILGMILVFSLLVHEYGHALTAFYFGARPQIVLEAFGGYTQYDSFKMSPKQQFIITLNGPLLESLLIAVPYSLLKLNIFENYYINFLLYATMRLNIFWCLLNLIPIAPLDGGYLLRYLLERKFGMRGIIASIIIGLVIAAFVAPYLFYRGFYFFGALLLFYAYHNYQNLRRYGFGSKHTYSDYVEGVDALKNNNVKKAKKILLKLLKTKDKEIKNSTIEYLAAIYYRENEEEKSYQLLLEADHDKLKDGKYLLCKLAYVQKNYPLITKYSRDIYELNPTYEVAVLNSKAFAGIGDANYAAAWLETASQFENITIENIKEELIDPIYDQMRNHDAFHSITEKALH